MAQSIDGSAPFTCDVTGSEHEWRPDGGCKTCIHCGYSPCA